MNKIDKTYLDLVQDIIDNGVEKETRNGGTISVFGRQIRHSMKDGFPLLTTKKLHWKSIVSELIWFLRGDTNIKWLLEQGNTIWVGDAYKRYWFNWRPIKEDCDNDLAPYTQEEFINRIKTDDEFAEKWGSLGKIYGAQWRSWGEYEYKGTTRKTTETSDIIDVDWKQPIDQIANLIKELKVNPDSRRLIVTAWNPADLGSVVLPPCHNFFQAYTRELSIEEKEYQLEKTNCIKDIENDRIIYGHEWEKYIQEQYEGIQSTQGIQIPTRAISLMWNQRSVDVGLGLPFNIASYGLLLEIIAKAVNMVPDELIGNLGDVHLYSNHIEPIKEQFGRDLDSSERVRLFEEKMNYKDFLLPVLSSTLDFQSIPKRTREPFPLPTLSINTEFWPTESGECGVGPIDAAALFNSFDDDNFCKCLLEDDIQLVNYQSHPTIKLPLSN